MAEHVPGLGETLPTDWTGVWLLSTVCPLMLHARGVVSEGTSTGPALVRLFTGVDPEVSAECGLLGKCLAADRTLVGTYTRVSGHMVIEVRVSSVAFLADGTLILDWFGDRSGIRGPRLGNT